MHLRPHVRQHTRTLPAVLPPPVQPLDMANMMYDLPRLSWLSV